MSLSSGFTCVLQKTTMSQQLPQKNIFTDNFTDPKCNLHSGLQVVPSVDSGLEKGNLSKILV